MDRFTLQRILLRDLRDLRERKETNKLPEATENADEAAGRN